MSSSEIKTSKTHSIRKQNSKLQSESMACTSAVKTIAHSYVTFSFLIIKFHFMGLSICTWVNDFMDGLYHN